MRSATEERPRISEYEYRRVHPDGSLGVFTAIALILLLWGLCWFKNYASCQSPQIINVVFHEVAGLSENASVYVDGVRVGMVEKIDWLESRKVAVKLRIQKDRTIVPVGSKFSILTNGVVGARYIDITFPERTAGGLTPIDQTIVMGEEPVRPELAVNNLAIAFSKIDMDEVQNALEEDRGRLIRATDDLSRLVNRSLPLIDKTIPLETKAMTLADDMTKISRRLHKLIDDPTFSRDLKETAAQANLTAQTIREVMQELNLTLKDKELRSDIITSLSKLNDATMHVEQSIQAVKSITGDTELRSDIKGILRDTRKTLSDVDRMMTKPGFGNDLKETLSTTREAIGHIDLAARQVNQILDKRAPLLHLLGGRPGKIKKQKVKQQGATENATPPEGSTFSGASEPEKTKTAEPPVGPSGPTQLPGSVLEDSSVDSTESMVRTNQPETSK